MRALVAELEREKYAVTTRQLVVRGSAAEIADEQLRRGKPEPEPCTYRSDAGERCRETALLELHHSVAFARAANIASTTSRCAAAHTTLSPPKRISAGISAAALAIRASTSSGPDTKNRASYRQKKVEGEGQRLRERWRSRRDTR
jgi:hypothetical protein